MSSRTRRALFSRDSLRDARERQVARLRAEVAGLKAMPAKRDAYTGELLGRLTWEVPRLDRSGMTQTSNDITIEREDFGRTIRVPGQRIDIHVPFSGTGDLFELQASAWSSYAPSGFVAGSDLVLRFEVTASEIAGLLPQINRELDEVDRYLAWTTADIAEHNAHMQREAEQALARREKELADVGAGLASLGIPGRAPAS
jgi:hypothetical protein